MMSDPTEPSKMNIEELIKHVQKMTDDELRQFGTAARLKCRKPFPDPQSKLDLEVAQAEWKKRKFPRRSKGVLLKEKRG